MAIVTVKRIEGKPPCTRYLNGIISLRFPLEQDVFDIEAGELYFVLRSCNMEKVPDPVLKPKKQEKESK